MTAEDAMNKGPLFNAIQHIERVHSQGLDRPAPPPKPKPKAQAAATGPPAPDPKPAPPPKPKPKAQAAATGPPAPDPKPPPLSPAKTLARRRAAGREVATALSERFPVFRQPCTAPLAIGVYHEIRAAVGDAIPAGMVRKFLRFWTGRPAYLAAMARGERRVHLDGSPAELPTADEQADAAARLADIQK